MSLNIGDALSTGAEKLQTTAGLQLGALSVIAVLLTSVGSDSIVTALGAPMARTGQPALALPVGTAGGAVLMLLGLVLTFVLTIVILRTMDHETAELDAIPAGVTDTLAKTTVFLVVAGIIQGIAVAIGLVLLIVPGLFALVSLYFAQVYIAVEGEGPIEALSSSWSLSKGSRFSIFGLVLVLAVIGALSALVGEAVGFVSPTVGSLVSLVVSGFLTVFSSATLVDAYHQLSAEQAEQEDLLEQPA